jgi:hypothetical protein
MGRQDDRHAVFLSACAPPPTCRGAAPRRRPRSAHRETAPRLMRQRLGDQHAPLHAARQRPDLAVALVPERQLPQDRSISASSRGLPNSPRENRTVLITFSKGSRFTSCGTSRPGSARRDNPSRYHGRPRGRVPPLGCTRPQTVPMSVVFPAPFGPEKREDLALTDIERHRMERREPAFVHLFETADFQNWPCHEVRSFQRRQRYNLDRPGTTPPFILARNSRRRHRARPAAHARGPFTRAPIASRAARR